MSPVEKTACAAPLKPAQLVFPGKRGGIIELASWRRHAWNDALDTAGVTYRPPQGMRDTFATLGLADGAPLEWIRRQMGHTEIDTTIKHYARWLPSAEERIINALNQTRAAETGLKPDSATGAKS